MPQHYASAVFQGRKELSFSKVIFAWFACAPLAYAGNVSQPGASSITLNRVTGNVSTPESLAAPV